MKLRRRGVTIELESAADIAHHKQLGFVEVADDVPPVADVSPEGEPPTVEKPKKAVKK